MVLHIFPFDLRYFSTFLFVLDSFVMFLKLLDTSIALLITLDIFLTSSLILASLELPDV